MSSVRQAAPGTTNGTRSTEPSPDKVVTTTTTTRSTVSTVHTTRSNNSTTRSTNSTPPPTISTTTSITRTSETTTVPVPTTERGNATSAHSINDDDVVTSGPTTTTTTSRTTSNRNESTTSPSPSSLSIPNELPTDQERPATSSSLRGTSSIHALPAASHNGTTWFSAALHEHDTLLYAGGLTRTRGADPARLVCNGLPALVTRSRSMPSNRACPDALTRLNASCTCLTSLAATASSWTFTVTSKPKTVVHGHNKSLMPPPPASRSTPSILAIDSIRPLSVPPTLTTLVLQSFDATPAPITFLPENSTDFETTALPLVLGSPHLLTTLSISTLNLNAIAATTTNFVPESVTTLTLRHCNLSTLRPAFTRSWRRVQVLDVSLNTLTTDFVVAAGALEHVNLSYNALTHFPTRLVQATPGLQALYLQGNALHDLNVSATAFQRIQALETLELDPRTPSSSSRTCPDGTWQRAHGASFCVLSASTANGPSTRSTSPEEAPQRLVAWLLVTALVVLALFLLVLWRRHRAARALAPERAASPSSSFVASTTPNYYAQSTSGYEVEAAAARPETTTLDRVDDDDAWTLHDLARHPVLTSCRLDVDDVHRGQCISRGGFGLVCIGHYRGRAVAVKTMRPAAPDVARDHVRQFVREIALMAQLAHPRIVEFLGACWTAPDDLACVTEFMERGDLRQVTQRWKRRGDVLTWTQHKASIALQIAQALVYLHGLAPCVIHRDLKAKNVMLNANMDAKVSDFGIARSRYGDGRDDHMTGGVGTSFWIAPEVLVGHEYDERADIYSYGVVLAELDTEDYPYWNAAHPAQGRTEEHAILRRVARGTQRPTFASTCPPAILELAAQCLQTEPADRPSALDIVHYLERVLPATTPVSLAPRRHDGRPLASQTIQELVSPSASIFDAASAPRATKGRAGAAGRDETVETTSDGPRTRTDGLSRI